MNADVIPEMLEAENQASSNGRVQDESVDVLVVGSGGGGLTGAITARLRGLTSMVVEKQDVVGGTTAFSGGVMWVPCNHLQPIGLDSEQDANSYVEAVSQDSSGPLGEVYRRRRAAFLRHAPLMLKAMADHGLRLGPTSYPDYHSLMPGAKASGRSVEALPFDKRELGSMSTLVASRLLLPRRLKIKTSEFASTMLGMRTLEGISTLTRVSVRSLWSAVRRADLVMGGEALVSQLLRIALDSGVTVRTRTFLDELVVDDGRIAGIRVNSEHGTEYIRATRGVLLAGGGYALNQEMRDAYGRQPSDIAWTLANPGETGDTLRAAMAVGASTDRMEAVWSNMVSFMPNGRLGMHGPDRSMPHSIIVDQTGRRFVNESAEHLEVADAAYRRHQEAPAIPAWLILESRHRNRYPFLGVPPRTVPSAWIESGFMKRADSIDALAIECGIDSEVLKSTVARFNQMALSGTDLDYGRGSTVAQRHYGDPRVRPNPVLGTLERPPFYAVSIYPGDVGTSGGMLTDANGRVLAEEMQPIPGLYACGNNAAPLFGGKYPGAGGSIAPSMTFGYIGATHMAEGG